VRVTDQATRLAACRAGFSAAAPRPDGLPEEDAGDEPKGEVLEEDLPQGASAPSPIGRLKAHVRYWRGAMAAMCLPCALTISILAHGYQLDWCEKRGVASAAALRNHPSAFKEAAFVTEAVQAGVAAGTMRPCTREFLRCVLPLGVATNSAGKLRLIWDGRHVNGFLRKVKFVMETLQLEGRALFDGASWGGAIDISSAYHHIEMHPDAFPFLGFEWAGQFFCFVVLPFGLASAPRIFTQVMRTPVAFMRWKGCKLLAYLDDLPFARDSAEAARAQGALMIGILRRFGWLVAMHKCVGIPEPVQVFPALGTLVDLVQQKYFATVATRERIMARAAALAGRQAAPARVLAAFKGLLGSTWLSIGRATSVRTRELGWVIDSRPEPHTGSKAACRRGWNSVVTITPEAQGEVQWWQTHFDSLNGQAFARPGLSSCLYEGFVMSDAGDYGYGGWAALNPDFPDPDRTALVGFLAQRCPPGATVRLAVRRALAGVAIAGSFPQHLLGASSAHREMFGLAAVLRTAAPAIAGGRFLGCLDAMACVFCLGGTVPPRALGGNTEVANYGGSRRVDLHRCAIEVLDTCAAFDIQADWYWVPRAHNEMADWLSHECEYLAYDYWLADSVFKGLDQFWGPHTCDRFATADNAMTLKAPNTGRFCSLLFEHSAEWPDALSLPWRGEVNWCHPPPRLAGLVLKHLRRCKAVGTLVVPRWVSAQWWSELYPCGPEHAPASFVVGVRWLGRGESCLCFPPRCDAAYGAVRHAQMIAFWVDCR
jgi:hypothetical protein